MSDLLMLNQVLSAWHDENQTQLTLLAKGDDPVFVDNGQGEQLEITGKLLQGVRLGATIALEVIGDLPYSVELVEEE